MLNVIIATGRLTKEPELRTIATSDTKICVFSLAIDNTRKEKDGTRGTCFLDCILFNERAEVVAQALHKGSKVAVHGSLNQRDFVRQDGSKGRAYEIVVNSIEFLDPKNDTPAEPEVESIVVEDPQPKFDAFTGKPLNKSKKA